MLTSVDGAGGSELGAVEQFCGRMTRGWLAEVAQKQKEDNNKTKIKIKIKNERRKAVFWADDARVDGRGDLLVYAALSC